MKQKLITVMLISAVAVGMLVFAADTKAGLTDNMAGWLWGGSEASPDATVNGNETGVGWVSMNNTNPGAGGAASYGVNVPSSGQVTGYAWSENLGYIDFNPQDHCTTGAPSATQYRASTCTPPNTSVSHGVFRTGNYLEGWARFVEIAKESANNNSGGWQGWIKFSNAYSGGIAVSGTSFTGYAWSDELGWVNFANATLPPPPDVTASIDGVLLDSTRSSLPQNTKIRWTSTGAANCDVTSTRGTWTQLAIGTSGEKDITVSPGTIDENFTVTCSGPGGSDQQIVSNYTFCREYSCDMSAGTCNESTKSAVTQYSECARQECNNNNQCKPPQIKGYKEVAP